MSEELKLLPCPFCGCNPVPPTSNYITVRCAWCGYEIPTEKWNRRSIPELPRVSPENLVEGEWYVFNYHTKFIPMIGKAEIHQGKFRLVDSFHSSKWSWANSETDIYGPLKFRIGGAE